MQTAIENLQNSHYQDGYTDGFSGYHPRKMDDYEQRSEYAEYCIGFCEGVLAASEEDMYRG